MKVLRPVYTLFLEVETTSYTENLEVKFDGLKMTDYDGNEILIQKRTHDITMEALGGGIVQVMIDIVNEGEEIEDRIDYMLDEEYELEPLVTVKVKSSGKILPWKVNLRSSVQNEKMMEVDMRDDVRSALNFITDSAVEYDPAFLNKMVQAFGTGKYDDLIKFINQVADL